MYSYNKIKTIHLEITSKCQAGCPMCARNIQGGVDNPYITLSEISFEKFVEWFPREFIKQLDRLFMCGNLGDPVVAKDTLEIFSYLKIINPNILLSMNTNGGARSTDWWEALARLGVTIRFGIDGLADTHHLYRIGTDFNKVITNATAFIDAGGDAVWDMLVFDHNQHQVEQCRLLSEQLGFKQFHSKNTSRFKDDKLNVLDKTGKTKYVIFATDRSKDLAEKIVSQIVKPKLENKIINCKVRQEGSLYISATGNVSPCCWLDMEWMPPFSFSRIDYMDIIGHYQNLNNQSLEDIFDSGFFDAIESTWSSNPLRECSKQCGEIDRFNEQFK